MDVRQLVRYTIGLDLHLARYLGVQLSKTYDVCAGRRSTISADDYPILELDGHNRRLDIVPIYD